jgi:glyoxylase-like metal-dependent hydrolase (beta-lactamase superfamily II)
MLLFQTHSFSQEATIVKATKLTEKLYKIKLYEGFEVNIIASIGENGLLLVDTGFKNTTDKLKAELKKLGNNTPTYIISTHEHKDHIGGNSYFGKTPIIIGHKNLKKRMLGNDYIYEEYPKHAIPEITFQDSLSLHFNGEDIRIISIKGSHTDNDIMVHFTKSGYAYMGDVAYGMHFPSVDITSGDDSKYGIIVKRALDMLPKDTKFVSGHGRDLSMPEMREWQSVLEETISVIHKGIKVGKDVETMQKEKILRKWEKYAKDAYVSTDEWIENVVNGFKNIKPPPTPEAKYYYAYKDGGIDSVKEAFFEVKQGKYGSSKWQPFVLYGFAYYLINDEKYNDAILIFEFCNLEYPNTYYFYDGLGETYWKKGDKKNAVKFYKKSLELEPKNTNATHMIKVIEQ